MPDRNLVNILDVHPNILVDVRFAGTHNFTGKVLYKNATILLHPEAAKRLGSVAAEAQELGLMLKVWDGFRPKRVQQYFWDLIQDERYVANPAKGARHTRGTAVDLTLTRQDGAELEMPSEYDAFGPSAHRDYEACSPVARSNRQLLEDLMHRHGFVGLATEWWHFDVMGWETFPELDLDI